MKITLDSPLAAGTYTLTLDGAVTPVDPVHPVDPIKPPPVSGGEDIFWGSTNLPFIDTQKVPRSGSFEANGDLGYSVGFIADATRFPNGIILDCLDQTPELRLKDICISAEAHSFTPISKYAANQAPVSDSSQFFLRFGPSQVYYDVALIPGGKYYINFRSTANPREKVSCEFTFSPR